MDENLSYYGKVLKILEDYEPKGKITQGELARELFELSLGQLS